MRGKPQGNNNRPSFKVRAELPLCKSCLCDVLLISSTSWNCVMFGSLFNFSLLASTNSHANAVRRKIIHLNFSLDFTMESIHITHSTKYTTLGHLVWTPIDHVFLNITNQFLCSDLTKQQQKKKNVIKKKCTFQNIFKFSSGADQFIS